jgi:threonine/homoserine/homoserine lactone efflux protein
MEWSEVLTFILVASLLVASPGPNGVLIAKTVPTSGHRAGLANVAGIVTGFYLHGALSILGISIILVQSATAFTVVKYLGALYLGWIGTKALYAAFKGNDGAHGISPAKHERTLVTAYMEGLLTNALNPKVSMFYLAAFPQFITLGETTAAASFLLVFVHSMIAAIWFAVIVMLFSKLAKATRSETFQRWLKGVTGIVFLGFALKLARYKPSF